MVEHSNGPDGKEGTTPLTPADGGDLGCDRTAKWLFVFFITLGWSGWVYVLTLARAEYWFAGTGPENFIAALLGTPWTTFYVQVVFHIHVLRKEGVYRRRETWLIAQSFQLSQGLIAGLTAIPQITGHLRVIFFLLLIGPWASILFGPFFTRYRIAYVLAFLMQMAVLLAYVWSGIYQLLNKKAMGGVEIYLGFIVCLSIAALGSNAVGLKSRLRTQKGKAEV